MRGWTGGLLKGFAVAATLFAAPVGSAFAGAMPTGGLTSQPIGHYEFCRAFRDQCQRQNRVDEVVALNDTTWDEILTTNARINHLIEPLSDLEVYGRDEVWTFPDEAGDCEDYVLLKRQLLMDAGFAPSSLLITVVRKPDGEGHAVLTVRTDQGDYILDNLSDEVVLWSESEYTFLKRQSRRHAGHWVSIEEADAVMAGAIN